MLSRLPDKMTQILARLIGRALPLCPSRMRLRLMAWSCSIIGWEPEVRRLKEIGPCRGMALDVGANHGFYSLALSRLYQKVVAFEPNKNVASPLIAAALPNVEIIHAGISSREGTARLFIPFVNGMVLPGWASLDEGNCPEATKIVPQEIPLRTLDSFEFQNVGFVKIDVEGHELEVLRGGSQTIQHNHPHLLIEVKEEHRAQVRTLLDEWGYCEKTLQDLAGVPGSPDNLIFVPLSPDQR